MTDYIHQTDNVIDVAAGTLPTAWQNVSGLDKASAASLKAKGWLPVVYVNETFDSGTQQRTGPTGVSVGDAVTPDADSVTGTYTILDRVPDAPSSVQASRQAEKDAEIVLEVSRTSDASAKRALQLIIERMGITS